jgi:hypothetical protein
MEDSMKRLALATAPLALLVPLFAAPAFADPADPVVQVVHAQTAQGPSVIAVPTVTVYGRPNRPMVQILVRTRSAADAAGAAHDRLRAATDAKLQPAAP